MVDPTPLPGRDADKPSPLDGLSKLELKTCALTWLDKAAQKHQEARRWHQEALRLTAELEALRSTREP
jgi:hypothetical protein